MRILLTNYKRDEAAPADINTLTGGPIASARSLFDEMIGFEASDLTDRHIELLRPVAYRRFNAELEDKQFLKVHDAWTLGPEGAPLFPADVTAGVVYIMRNPLDVALSAANHWGVSVDQSIANLGQSDYTMSGSVQRLKNQLTQILLSWSDHVISWVDHSGLPVLVVRYEDMQQDTTAVLRQVVAPADWPVDDARLAKAVAFSAFDKLQEQEDANGFREAPMAAERFFRKGISGDWREQLTADQIATVIAQHGQVMRRFGYLDANDNPILTTMKMRVAN